jgi:hypothetical protein
MFRSGGTVHLYLGTIVTNQNLIQAEIRTRLSSGRARYLSSTEPVVFSVAVKKHRS